MTNFKISVISICLNDVEGLNRTLESLFSQTLKNFEVIVINGGSDRDLRNLVVSYGNRINCFVSEPDRGIYDAMNKGIRLAEGDFCIFLNSGDEFYSPNVLEQFAEQVKDCNCLYFGRAQICGSGLNWFYPERETRSEDIIKWLSLGYKPNHQAMFFPRSFCKNNFYNLRYRFSSDQDYKLRAFEELNYKFLDFPVCKFYLGGVSNRSNFKNVLRRAKESVILNCRNRKSSSLRKVSIFFMNVTKHFLGGISLGFCHRVQMIFKRYVSDKYYSILIKLDQN